MKAFYIPLEVCDLSKVLNYFRAVLQWFLHNILLLLSLSFQERLDILFLVLLFGALIAT